MAISPDRIEQMSRSVIASLGRDFPTCTAAELLSTVFTVMRGLVAVVLEDPTNKAHNQAEILKCLGILETDVWAQSRPSKLD